MLDTDDFASDIINSMLESEHKICPDKGLAIAQLLLTEGPDFHVDLLLKISEAIMILSANAGSSDTRKYLDEQWPKLRPAHRSRLLRAKSRRKGDGG